MKRKPEDEEEEPKQQEDISSDPVKPADDQGLPYWLAHPVRIEADSEPTPLKDIKAMFPLSKRIYSLLEQNDISSLFPVQAATFPFLLSSTPPPSATPSSSSTVSSSRDRFISAGGGDLCVAAPTGSGKTLSFVIPIVEKLCGRVVTRLRALVILPTRDLATQVKETFDSYVVGSDLKVVLATGHSNFQREQEKLVEKVVGVVAETDGGGSVPVYESKVDILVCTPGRLMDHLGGTEGFSMEHLEFLVIDEADRLLTQSYQNWLPTLLSRIEQDCCRSLVSDEKIQSSSAAVVIHSSFPASFDNDAELNFSCYDDSDLIFRNRTRKWLFSATLTRNPEKIASLQLHEPTFIHVTSGNERYSIPSTIQVRKLMILMLILELMILMLILELLIWTL